MKKSRGFQNSCVSVQWKKSDENISRRAGNAVVITSRPDTGSFLDQTYYNRLTGGLYERI